MATSQLTHHAIQRMGQRGFHDNDFDLIQLIGTAVEGGFIVLERDCQAAEHELKRLLGRIRRLGGSRLVVAGDQIITAYRAGKSTKRRLVRGAEERELAA